MTFIKVRVYLKALVSTSAHTWHSSGPTSAYERWSFDMGDRPALWPHPSRHVSHGGDVVGEAEDTSPKARRGPPARPPAAAALTLLYSPCGLLYSAFFPYCPGRTLPVLPRKQERGSNFPEGGGGGVSYQLITFTGPFIILTP